MLFINHSLVMLTALVIAILLLMIRKVVSYCLQYMALISFTIYIYIYIYIYI